MWSSARTARSYPCSTSRPEKVAQYEKRNTSSCLLYTSWRDGEADKLTQLVFCDISTPQAKATASKAAKTLDNPLLHALEGAVPLPEQEPTFTVYDDIRQKLIAQGMPADQIAFIHEANTEVRKKELFSKVRTGQVRVLLGSTAKMGACLLYTSFSLELGKCCQAHYLSCSERPLSYRTGTSAV